MKSGKGKKSKRLRLGSRDRALLTHLDKCRMSWFEVLQVVLCAGGKSGALKSTLQRLRKCKPALIRSIRRPDKHVFYQLTFAGTRAIGTTHHAAEALGRTTIIRQFALQAFFFLNNKQQRHLLSQAQLGILFDMPKRRLPKAQFYLTSIGKDEKRLGLVVVDFGSEPRRCANRLVDRVLQLLKSPKIQAMAEAQLFEISVLTLSAAKRKSLYQRLNVSKRSGGNMLITNRAKRFRVRLFIHVIPGLLELIPDSRE